MSPKTTPKDILLTGASGAIGSAIARRLSAAGFTVHLTSRHTERLAPLMQELTQSGTGSVRVYQLDLSNIAQCQNVVAEFFHHAEHPYGLICNAGDLGALGLFLQINFEEWSRSFQQNTLGHMAMIQAFGKLYASENRKGGSIVLLSGAGLGSAVNHTHISCYGTAKAALTYLAEALAPELKAVDVIINAIAPGQVKSGITEQAVRAGQTQVGAYALTAQQCMDKGGVSPELAAHLVEFLMGPDATTITGRLLSARFDQEHLRKETKRIAEDPDLYRLRRIDDDLFAKRR